MAQTTWAADTNTWASTTNVWANTAYSDTVTFGSTVDTSSSNNTQFGVIANMTQLNLTELNEEDAIKLASAILGASVGTTASASVAIPVSVTLAETSNLTNNINFEESITLSATGNITSTNNFLWNDVTEDTSTTWTKVADPDE